jgi:hypothetical protein
MQNRHQDISNANQSYPYYQQDDEIDLFELFETLWDGKWLIISFALLTVLLGFLYTQTVQDKYKVSVSYVINIHSLANQPRCGNDIRCQENQMISTILWSIGSDWTKEKNIFTQTVFNPESIEHYQHIFSVIQNDLNKTVLEQAKGNIDIIESDFLPALLGTESIATSLLDAKRVVTEVGKNGINVMSIDTPSVSIMSRKTPLILSVSALLGGMAAILYIIIRSAIRKRKEPLHNEI